MFELIIKGFNTEAEVEAFADWYEGQGEQDARIWFECQKIEGKIEVDTMNVDLSKPYKWEENKMVMHIKPD